MLLVVDIGNSNIVWGLFDGQTLKGHWRIATDTKKTADEYGILFQNLLHGAGIKAEPLSGAILSSVVPALTATFETMTETYFGQVALVVSCEMMNTGLTFRYDQPREIGADRIVNAVAAYARYRTSLIIIDFGTATTFCVVTQGGEYLGGVIAPGLGISADALFTRTAKLPKVELTRPKTVIGRDTGASIQAGLLYGYAGLVDEIVHRIEQELGYKTLVVATGGLSSIIAPESRTIQELRPLLTLEGLELLYRRSRGEM
ncbi:MAG: type III pantothenate kinase [Nitrospiraceae bacterium]